MAKITLIVAILLVALGLAGYLGTGSVHPTALIPAWFGLALGVFGFLAMSPSESRRKLFMHINVTIGLLGFLGGAGAAVQGYLKAHSQGIEPDRIALASKLGMAGLLLIYVALCVRSFIAARRAGRV
ncbi:MAG TPA: hypothetical protein VHX20_20660 [Terracidiphilus sp.]|jgi:hypothetical protein|nr:hypothetical protein [Terracidiphilus sp.]